MKSQTRTAEIGRGQARPRSLPRLSSAARARRPQPRETQRDVLIATHLRLARLLAGRLQGHGEASDDLVQVAMVGLVKAADRFDPTFGTQFTTYASATITGELKRHFRDTRWGVRVQRSKQELYLLVRAATDWATIDLRRSPTVAEIAAQAGVSLEEVIEARELGSALYLESIDRSNNDHQDERPEVELGMVDSAMGVIDDRLSLIAAIHKLRDRDRRILHLRFTEEMTQREIGQQLGISQMHVSRLLASAIATLRETLSSAALADAPPFELTPSRSSVEAHGRDRLTRP